LSKRRRAPANEPGSGAGAPHQAAESLGAARWIVPLFVAVAAFLPYAPTLGGDFVTWDDNRNFLDNPHYRGLGWRELGWMWTTFHMGHYVPLTWMTLGLDFELWGMDPFGYHLVNTALHAANAVLVYFLARRLLALARPATPSDTELTVPCAVAALAFAIHPLRVESVAWITERRDMLSLLFGLASVLAYVRSRADHTRAHRWYWGSVVLFACTLLSKATLVTLPAIFLLLNVYPLRRLGGGVGWSSAGARRVYRELAPFAALSLAVSVLSLVALDPPNQLGPGDKIAASAYSLAFYIRKTIVPSGLAPLYEMPPDIDPLAPRYLASYGMVALLAVGAVLVRRRWPGLTAAVVAFVVITLPMLGIVQNGPQIAADRYTYHAAPVVGLLVGGALARWRGRPLRVATLTATAALSVLAVLTWRQTDVWRDSDRLWSRVLSVDSTSSVAQIAMGDLRIAQGRLDEAALHYGRGVAIDTGYAEGHNNLGVALSRLGKVAEAADRFRMAAALDTAYADAYANWGVALSRLGDHDAALQRFRRAIALDARHADARVNYGNALLRSGQAASAVEQYRAANEVRPGHPDTHVNWGAALAQLGRYTEAADRFREALSLDPSNIEAREYLDRATRLAARQDDSTRRDP
jgi:tetratricopeptide (TPR) repeat protein